MEKWEKVTDNPPLSECLVFYRDGKGKGKVIRAIYCPKHYYEAYPGQIEGDIEEYDEETDAFYWPEGWWECVDNWDTMAYIQVHEGEVTHWMPLPNFPEDG